MHAERDAQFSLAQAAIGRGADPGDVAGVLLDCWNSPSGTLSKAADDEKRSRPGGHGIPAIARSERAFYRGLTAGQKRAYKAVRDLVNELHRTGQGWGNVDPWDLDEPIEQWKQNAFTELAMHPMQAFLLGQMLAQAALEGGIARPLVPTDREAIKYLEHQTFNEIGSAFDRFKGDLRTALIEGMQEGENPREVARRLAATFNDYKSDFELLAITENTRAEAQGRLHEFEDAGSKWAVRSSADDAKTCDGCKQMIDGKRINVTNTIGKSNYGRKREDWIPVVPLHPRCRCVLLPYTTETAEIIRGADK